MLQRAINFSGVGMLHEAEVEHACLHAWVSTLYVFVGDHSVIMGLRSAPDELAVRWLNCLSSCMLSWSLPPCLKDSFDPLRSTSSTDTVLEALLLLWSRLKTACWAASSVFEAAATNMFDVS